MTVNMHVCFPVYICTGICICMCACVYMCVCVFTCACVGICFPFFVFVGIRRQFRRIGSVIP